MNKKKKEMKGGEKKKKQGSGWGIGWIGAEGEAGA